MKTSYVARSSRILYLFDITASDMARIQRFLFHPDPLTRSAGYYGLLESGTVDSAYLLERYEEEREISVKMVILYVLFCSGNHEEVREIRADASEEIRNYIDTILITSDPQGREGNLRILF